MFKEFNCPFCSNQMQSLKRELNNEIAYFCKECPNIGHIAYNFDTLKNHSYYFGGNGFSCAGMSKSFPNYRPDGIYQMGKINIVKDLCDQSFYFSIDFEELPYDQEGLNKSVKSILSKVQELLFYA